MELVKKKDDKLTEELVASLVGKFVYVPTNIFDVSNGDVLEQENIWFAGQVGGYSKVVLQYEYNTQRFAETPHEELNLLLTDGMGYALSNTNCEMYVITEDEFMELLAEHHARQIVNSKLYLPGRDF
ncbi:hypothetical protein E308F_30570 [Moorella sp. E308F]|uniref:hypothetical protein n=1 Tax=Moorella sp. E308F TaxID=2572682 RepID=UPI0010FFBC84|nr:hypothetical protein [Moorella sp. E308F]GEA16811.1 hypothetical protein E308F_30570 [Moorella sp. E308F]